MPKVGSNSPATMQHMLCVPSHDIPLAMPFFTEGIIPPARISRSPNGTHCSSPQTTRQNFASTQCVCCSRLTWTCPLQRSRAAVSTLALSSLSTRCGRNWGTPATSNTDRRRSRASFAPTIPASSKSHPTTALFSYTRPHFECRLWANHHLT
ncbi:uncharacterized protein BCR38DRAFT_472206 [Pseudomassariella vexata]|uniref:Uncharacterized protein n=1 Tax=Pseudomassariella vexata TaxID=1141098 RepID=A0A1Y2EAX6_9PEZI|nr:uncharacterized protein BCR38DRAFT_472206 [Pseudomassariella vexata]ORY68718.1 hypothetical protein BCR38DRAFT_472206 [Pseudomassariella vexata]